MKNQLKSTLISGLILVLPLGLLAGNSERIKESEVPVNIVSGFKKLHPDADGLRWKLNEDKSYSAIYLEKKREFESHYSADGTWQYSEHPVDYEDIPRLTKNAYKLSDYKDNKVIEATRVYSEKFPEAYGFKNKSHGKVMVVWITAEGHIVKEMQME